MRAILFVVLIHLFFGGNLHAQERLTGIRQERVNQDSSALFDSSQSSDTLRIEQQDNYGGMGMIIDSFYRLNYSYPESIKDLLAFIDYYDFPEVFNGLISNLHKNRNDIEINKAGNHLIITAGKEVIYDEEMRSPCDELSYDLPFYLQNILIFDKNGVSIDSEKRVNEFKKEIKQVKLHFDNVVKKDGSDVFVLVSYTLSDGLTPICSIDYKISDYKYFDLIDDFLSVFVSKNKISKMIFTTPIFIKEPAKSNK
ncbi:hypothetical protein PbJCM13498_01250 [Prolixibacter bellariivorans]|uniref:Uncharacterized protein n=1 Tax=Prolixibacter bellariivorans TaxID=314319 RepID=A0A5M4ATQ0_9BACT|nr:hypothetical protein [Prolixibacter bellariivorans]GET31262.1 hypothetical protein PbJCM13498_01250 [Prolixibacter bellariivorans]